MFKIVKINKKASIVNSNGDLIYTIPDFLAHGKRFNLSKLLAALNAKGFRDIDTIIAFESGKLT